MHNLDYICTSITFFNVQRLYWHNWDMHRAGAQTIILAARKVTCGKMLLQKPRSDEFMKLDGDAGNGIC